MIIKGSMADLIEEVESLKSTVNMIKNNLEELMSAGGFDDRLNRIECCFKNALYSGQTVGITKDIPHERKPHKCPACDSTGKYYIDPNRPLSGLEGLDESGLLYKICNSCEGKGIVWG